MEAAVVAAKYAGMLTGVSNRNVVEGRSEFDVVLSTKTTYKDAFLDAVPNASAPYLAQNGSASKTQPLAGFFLLATVPTKYGACSAQMAARAKTRRVASVNA